MNVTKIPADVLFRVHTACAGDTRTLILDIRPLKEFKKKHIIGSYSIRLAATGGTLLDYSKNTYDYKWSKDCWWDKHIVVYGDADLKRSHPVVSFLASDKHAKSINIYSEGLGAFEQLYPFLVTASTKANASRRYPGEIIPKLLYLGDWAHATDYASLEDLRIFRILTIHNNPENLKPTSKFKHKQIILADVETEDISKHFNESFTYIEEARTAKEGVLVHCGAGVSRSSAICIAYLMRKFTWPAAKAKAHCIQRRSVVQPNDGFWRSLCALEGQLGIMDRSDPQAVSGFSGADAPARTSADAAGEKVVVTFMSMAKVREMEAAEKAAAARKSASLQAMLNGQQEDKGQHDKMASGSGQRNEERGSKHAADRHEERRRDSNARSDREDRGVRDRHGRQDESRAGSPRHSRGNEERGPHKDQRRGQGDRGRQREDREMDRKGRRRSSSRERPARDSKRGRDASEGRDQDRDKRRKPDSKADKVLSDTDVKMAAPVVLESSKEGKAIGRLELGLHSPHQRCLFGRLPSNEVVLEHLSISRQHAQLSLDPTGELLITDLGSAHQTNVDGMWIRPHQAKALPVGAIFKLGGSTREFKVIMTPKERAKVEARRKKQEDLEEAKRNTEILQSAAVML